MGLTKTSLIDTVAERTGSTKASATDMVDAMIWAIENELKNGGEVALTGFGKFSVSQRAARMGRNPQTGAQMQIAASRVPRFSPGSKLKALVNGR